MGGAAVGAAFAWRPDVNAGKNLAGKEFLLVANLVLQD